MKKFFIVALWEYLERVKTKAFFIGLLLPPISIALFTGLPGLLLSKADEETRNFGIIDETQILVNDIAKRLDEKYLLPNGKPNYHIITITDEIKEIEHLKVLAKSKVLANEIEGYYIIPKNILEKGNIEYRAKNVGNVKDLERFSRICEEVIIQKRLEQAGYNAEKIRQLSTDVNITTIKVTSSGEEKESGFLETFMSGYIFIMMLMFLVLTTGQMLIRSVVEEKSNRLVEVLISSCSANDLIIGKVLGLSFLGLTTVAFWSILIIAATIVVPTPFITIENILVLSIYFIIGYLFYATIFVAFGSPVSTEQEAQQVTSYLSMVMVLPIALAIPIMQRPESLLVKILTFIPLFTPTFMALRLSIQMPEWWEIVLSLFILIISTIGMMWIAAKIFRIGILVTGKRPTIKELVRWVVTKV